MREIYGLFQSTSINDIEKVFNILFKIKEKKPFSAGQLIGLILGPLLFLLTLLFFHPQDLPWKGVYVLAITLWIATWWITEAIPIAATSLLPIVLLPLGHILTPEQVSSEYGNDIIFCFRWIYFGNCNGKMEFTYESSVDNY